MYYWLNIKRILKNGKLTFLFMLFFSILSNIFLKLT